MATKKEQIGSVWIAWLAQQKRPDLCRFTAHREKLIGTALKDVSAADLRTLIAFAYESDHRQARWWQGQNPRRKRYQSLEFLLQPTKLALRVELALRWREGVLEDGDADLVDEESDGESDGYLARRARRGRGRSLRREK